jgi:hypothetical protein
MYYRTGFALFRLTLKYTALLYGIVLIGGQTFIFFFTGRPLESRLRSMSIVLYMHSFRDLL